MAMAVAAAVIITAAIAYQSASQSTNRLGTYGAVSLPAGTYANFYAQNNTSVNAYYAPNYGRVAAAEVMRQTFYEDLQYASAVFCLPRTGRSTVRPTTIPIDSALYPNFDARTLSTPEDFRVFLSQNIPSSASVFSAYRGPATAQNLSIFILVPSDSIGSLTVRAVYEEDFVPCANPLGTYVSVRRYDNYSNSKQAPTDYYDIFYPASNEPEPFEPVVVHFERYARRATIDAYDPWKMAANRPFYFLWWPDPAARSLEGPDVSGYGSADPRSAYAIMGGRTSFFMVVPMFPAL